MDIANLVLKLNKGVYVTETMPFKIDEKTISNHFIGCALIFVNSVDIFEKAAEYIHFFRYLDEPIVVMFHIMDVTFGLLKNSNLKYCYMKLELGKYSTFHYSYFIIDEGTFISLSTFEWFANHCNQAELVRLNIFDKSSLKWTLKLKFYEKFLDYNGCKLIMGLPYAFTMDKKFKRETYYNPYYSGYTMINHDETGFTVHGISPIVFRIASKKYNFIDAYWPTDVHINNPNSNISFISMNNFVLEPTVYFYISGSKTALTKGMLTSNAFYESKSVLFVTPAEAYTPYEKLFLPFDLQTWMFLVVTFFLTFLSIFTINRLPRIVQNFVYGTKVKTPILNVWSIFFGIAQTKLPIEIFSRFILILFIFFCLIIRTSYQGLLFKFMKTEPRHSPPKTIQDLIERNYTIYSPETHRFLDLIGHENKNW